MIPVDGWSFDLQIAVAADIVEPQCINGDRDQVEWPQRDRRGFRVVLDTAAGSHSKRKDTETPDGNRPECHEAFQLIRIGGDRLLKKATGLKRIFVLVDRRRGKSPLPGGGLVVQSNYCDEIRSRLAGGQNGG